MKNNEYSNLQNLYSDLVKEYIKVEALDEQTAKDMIKYDLFAKINDPEEKSKADVLYNNVILLYMHKEGIDKDTAKNMLEIDIKLFESKDKDKYLDNYIQDITSNIEKGGDRARSLSSDSLDGFKSGLTTPESLSRGSSYHSIESLGLKIMKEQSSSKLIPESASKNNKASKKSSIKR